MRTDKPNNKRLVMLFEKVNDRILQHPGWYDAASDRWFCLSEEMPNGDKVVIAQDAPWSNEFGTYTPHQRRAFIGLDIVNIVGWVELCFPLTDEGTPR